MRPIDADALKEYIGAVRAKFNFFDDDERPRYEAHSKAIYLLDLYVDSAPSIDIVFCKECKHRYDDWWLEPRWTCDYLKDMRLKDDDFCSYGERKGECKECWHWSEVHKRCENKCGCQFKPYGEREGE